MDNEKKNENLNDNQFFQEELNNSSEGVQEETPVAETTPEKPLKKKLSGKLVALMVILVVILAGSITAFANRNQISNTLAMMTKSSSEYYAYIEQKNLNKQIDSFTKNYGKSLAYNKNGISTDNNLTFSISPEFAAMMGLSQIKPISAQFESTTKSGLSSFNGTLSYDNKTLASLEMLYDLSTSDYYFRVPELSTAYLLMSMKDIMNAGDLVDTGFDYSKYMDNIAALLNGELLSEGTLNAILKKYSSDIYSNINTIELKKNEKVTASKVTSSYNKLTAIMTDKDVYNIAMAVLEDAKEDKDLAKILVALQVLTEDEYNEAIDTAINDLKDNEATLTNEPLMNMILYVDDLGNIMGRELIVFDEINTSIGYSTAKNGADLSFNIWVKENDENVLEITADGTTGNNGFTGDSVIAINYYDEFYGETTSTNLNVALENVKVEDNKLNGKFTITSDVFLGMEFVAELKAADKQQDMNIKVMAGGMEALTLNLTAKEIPFKEVQKPSSSEQVFDMINDMESYMGTADLEGFMTNIQNVLGEDFGPLFEGLLSGM